MTTVTLTGLRVEHRGDSTVSTGETQLMITVPSRDTTFSYSITGIEDDLPVLELDGAMPQILLDWQSLNALEETSDVTASIVSVTWGGNRSTVLVLDIETGPNSDSLHIFTLAGDPIPTDLTVSEWNRLDDSISAIGAATGDFAAGNSIRWSSLNPESITEDDEMIGTVGRDRLSGGVGDDYFYSSQGNDTYLGGTGYDQVTFQHDPNGVIANLATGRAVDGWGNRDVLSSIEMLRGSNHADRLTGNSGDNIIRGLAGADTLDGGKGRDQVRYDRDSRHEGGENGVTVNLGKGFAIDGFGDRDTLRSFESARGSDFNDRLTGTRSANTLEGELGNDRLSGLSGNDSLDGGDGNDTLEGGAGNDTLRGNIGEDLFIFRGSFGDDVITGFGFESRIEKISLAGVSTITSFRDLKRNHLTEENGDTVINDGRGNTITLIGIEISDLSAGDFLF
ncbi:calcium-binding protein [Gemmobacter denitrificans]|uniref:Calcium-binding protein n=1 Tax=Gemmobacter denitrificans TaxID=3123040 RepID=A0ABU8BR24_9RHOB